MSPTIADAHLDLAYLAVAGRDLTAELPAASGGCVSFPALRRGGVRLALGTIFTEPGAPEAPYGYADHDDTARAEAVGRAQMDTYRRWEEQGHVRLVRCRADLDGWDDGGPLRVVILMEGADPIVSPDAVADWVEAGMRAIGLSWAHGSRYSGGNARAGGLTPAGRELVAALDAHGIVHDLSHLSDESFDDMLAIARGPIFASHSNCRSLLSPSVRHLRDDHIAAIATRGGVVGLNLCTNFLADDRRATVDDCIRHLDHAAAHAGGRRFVCLGSDMDGGFGPENLPAGVDAPERLAHLLQALGQHGWSQEEVRAFASTNLLEFLRRALPA
ncbi:MAG: membrane dipeptidase [Phycisphaerales bacterium]|nr:membrane dipeptidase [Phycisphaerales bacterium]